MEMIVILIGFISFVPLVYFMFDNFESDKK